MREESVLHSHFKYSQGKENYAEQDYLHKTQECRQLGVLDFQNIWWFLKFFACHSHHNNINEKNYSVLIG